MLLYTADKSLLRSMKAASKFCILLAKKVDILNLWTKHYSLLLGDRRVVSRESLSEIRQETVNTEIDEFNVTSLVEDEKVIGKLMRQKRLAQTYYRNRQVY